MRVHVQMIRFRFVTVAGATFFLLGVLFIWSRDSKQEQMQSFVAPKTQEIQFERIAIPREPVGDRKQEQQQSYVAPKTQENKPTLQTERGNTKTQEVPDKLEESEGFKKTEVISDKAKRDSDDPSLPATDKKEKPTFHRQTAHTNVVPCGPICSYTGVRKAGKHYPYIEKQVDCNNLLFRMGNPQAEPDYPPPRSPPSRMYRAFTQNGDCPITGRRYMVEFSPKEEVARVNITADTMAMLTRRDGYGHRINTYPDSQLLRDVLHRLKQYISGKRALVIGTIRPWLEAMLVNLDASHVTTSEYTPMHIDHPKMLAKHPKEVAKDIMSGRVKPFDFIVSFSSIEHSGLGRYGDLLDPYGDLEAVAQVWCMIKPGGIFILGLPLSEDGEECSITWNAHRLYGYSRLQHVTANWEVLEINHPKDRKLDIHAVLVLKKAS